MTAETESQEIARGIVESISDEKLIMSVPGTDYQIHLVPAVPASEIGDTVGKRIKGTIHARALRLFKASGGGQFIEPIWGEPRIVAGRVLTVDQPDRRILVDVAVPIWMTLVERQPADMFKVGDMVNCYVESGTRFTPR